MPYDLSFTQEFFTGTVSFDEMEPSERPTSVMQAIISLEPEAAKEIALKVLGYNGGKPDKHLDNYIQTEEFAWEVLDKVKETNACRDISSPVDVFIDDNWDYWLTVYGEEETD